MSLHRVKLLRREVIAEQTLALYFEKPNGFSFEAGQFGEWKLLNSGGVDPDGNLRPFSFASAPHEEALMIATRLRNTPFKTNLRSLESGTELQLDGPYGSFLVHENSKRPAVILTGGIGITPFRSIAVDTSHKKLPHSIFLFYSNRRPEDAPFLSELKELEKENSNYRFIPTMTDVRKSRETWTGERGYITEEMLSRYVDKSLLPIYYIAGPQEMVQGLWQMLTKAGISRDDIKTEEFPGY